MLSYCLKCRKNTESKIPRVVKKNKGKPILLFKCAVCDSKKFEIYQREKVSGLLSNLGLKTSLSKILILDDILF